MLSLNRVFIIEIYLKEAPYEYFETENLTSLIGKTRYQGFILNFGDSFLYNLCTPYLNGIM